jgi:Flp pilus assembly pilin Flp
MLENGNHGVRLRKDEEARGSRKLPQNVERNVEKAQGRAAKEDLTWGTDPRSIKTLATLRHLAHQLASLFDDTSGTTAVEYALIAGAIAGVIVVVVYALGSKVNNLYSKGSW